MLIFPSRNFEKEAAKLPSKIFESLRERLELFKIDPFAKLLNNHKLHGSFKHYRSINITGDYRLIFEQFDENTVRLVDVGTHSELFGK